MTKLTTQQTDLAAQEVSALAGRGDRAGAGSALAIATNGNSVQERADFVSKVNVADALAMREQGSHWTK
jgi:hypothetical protein